jgi:hypothetical protein
MNLGIPPRNVRVGLDRHFFANTGAGTSTDAQPGHRSGGWHELRDHARSLGVALSRDPPMRAMTVRGGPSAGAVVPPGSPIWTASTVRHWRAHQGRVPV